MWAIRAKAAFWALWVLLLVGFCCCSDKSLVVEGIGDCADCLQKNIKSSDAFSGLGVIIDCKLSDGQFKIRGTGKLGNDGKFQVALPSELVNDKSELIEQCFAHLQSAMQDPCPTHNGLEPSKLVLKSKDNGKHIFGTTKKLTFTPSTCASDMFSHHHHKFFHFPIYKPEPKPEPKAEPKPEPKPEHKSKPKPKTKPEPKPEYKPKPKPEHKPKPEPKPEPKPKTPCPPKFKKPIPHIPKLPIIYRKPFHHIPKHFPIPKKPHFPHPKFPSHDTPKKDSFNP